MAPNADIIAVKGGEGSFSSADLVEGVQYIFKRADALGRPAVVNLSLGTLYGPHDGTEADEQAIDSLSGPGHIVVIAAGNSGSNPTATTGNSAPFYVHATRTLLVIGAPQSMQISPFVLISGRRSVKGWYSGTAADSQDTLKFSVLAGVRSMNEVYPLEKVTEAYERMMSGKARFRVVLKIGS